LRVGNTWTGGVPTPPQAQGLANTFDLNTFFTWTYLSSGGATSFQTPPPVIQGATGSISLLPSTANTTYILTSGNEQNFTTAGLGPGNAGAVWYVKNGQDTNTGINIAVKHNTAGITGSADTLYHPLPSTNSSIQILYWDGSTLTMY
jgi:hypothetical protein